MLAETNWCAPLNGTAIPDARFDPRKLWRLLQRKAGPTDGKVIDMLVPNELMDEWDWQERFLWKPTL